MRQILSFLCLGLWGVAASAQPLSDEACERLLLAAETNPDPVIYDDCGFGDEARAWNQWAPLASTHNMKHALFELCRRYPEHTYGPMYCGKAIALNFGPALAYMGYQNLKAKNTTQALSYFARAVKSGDLSKAELIRLMEVLGILYMTPESPSYAPDSGIALLTKAAENGSAMANNALAYLSYSGQHNIQKDDQKTLSYLWKSILIGCPAAEENLGAFHLARQKKISVDDAAYYMSLQAFTCTPFDKDAAAKPLVPDCNCTDILKQEEFFRSTPYLYIDLQNDNKALLRDSQGNLLAFGENEILPDGSLVQELRPTLVVLLKNGKKTFVNRYHTGYCVNQCLKYATEKPKRTPVGIRPYHLTFTPQECQTLDYYAQKLVDTTGPYVGKKECHPEAQTDEATQLLLQK